MQDENKLIRESAAGRAATQALENEALNSAFETLHRQYLMAWRNTHVEDTTGREKLFLAVNILDKVKEHLITVAANGRLSDKELADLHRRQKQVRE
jgi:hypothetical protein